MPKPTALSSELATQGLRRQRCQRPRAARMLVDNADIRHPIKAIGSSLDGALQSDIAL